MTGLLRSFFFLVMAAVIPLVPAQNSFDPFLNASSKSSPPAVEASLVAGQSALVPGQPFDIALKLQHPEHWHTYWLNPGLGTPTSLKWDLPPGWQTTPLIWPIPEIKPTELGNQHIFSGTLWLFTTVTPPADLKTGETFTLKGAAKWLVCDEGSVCMPGGQQVELKLPVAAQAEPVAAVKAELEKVRAAQPQSTPSWEVKLEPEWTLTLSSKEGANSDPGEIYFFDEKGAISNEPQKVTKDGGTIKIIVAPAEGKKATPSGYVYASKGWLKDGTLFALAIGNETPVRGPPAVADSASSTSTPAATASSVAGIENKSKVTFLGALAGLFLAGMILNLMPCVFPVLALKVLSFAKQGGKDPAETRKHSFAYTLGLLVFVWLVAGGMFVAKAVFHLEFAWGDLTRYSGPMAAVVIVLFLLGLNLAGLFEIGTSLGSVGEELQDKKGYAGSFWSGALTMLISTPCSGPFMAVAMGYALQQSAIHQFILFTAFGLGIAFPYVLLSSSPRLLKKLPRPGAWMETFKTALAFPMFAAAIYFYNTFADKTGADGASLLLWALLFIAVGAWIYGHWCVPSRIKRTRLIGGLAAILSLAIGTWFSLNASRQKAEITGNSTGVYYKTGDLAWAKWSPEVLAAERAKGRPIFVNYTTLGCITCDTNEAKVFKAPVGSDKVIAKFKELNVAPLRAKYLADGTPEDEAIRTSLKPWEISTFPAYVMYPADASKPPVLISDSLLSQADVLAALQQSVQ